MHGQCSRIQRGMTLIEVIIVIFIIGILSGVVVYSTGVVTGRVFLKETDRLMLAFNQAMDLSLFSQQTLGWFYDPASQTYQFQTYSNDNSWQPLQASVMTRHQMEGDISLKVNSDLIELETGSDESHPAIIFFSSGEYSPFTMTLKNASRTQNIEGDGFRQIQQTATH